MQKVGQPGRTTHTIFASKQVVRRRSADDSRHASFHIEIIPNFHRHARLVPTVDMLSQVGRINRDHHKIAFLIGTDITLPPFWYAKI